MNNTRRYEVVMVVNLEATSMHGAFARARLAAALAHEHLRGEWKGEVRVIAAVELPAHDAQDAQQELPL